MALSGLRPHASLGEIVGELNQFRDLLGDDAYLRIRTVAIQHLGQWWNHATTITVEPGDSIDAHPLVIIRDVALVETTARLGGDLTTNLFEAIITGWRGKLGAGPAAPFQDPAYVDRQHSRPPTSPYPEWACRLHERVTNTPQATTHPSGPFLSSEHGIFAPDVPRLTVEWLRESFWSSRTNLAFEYRLRIPDRRARLASLHAEGNRLDVMVESITQEGLFCGVLVKTFTGFERTFIDRIVDLKASFDLETSVQELSVWIMLENGQPLDSYEESPHRASWGIHNALFNRPRSADQAMETELDVALTGGETQATEFKPFVRLNPRDYKADELLETVCAFTNATGGTLFFGVTDYAEPDGIDSELRRAYGERCQGDEECLRDSYVIDIRRLLNEGLLPAVIPSFKWYDLAHRWILAAVVPPSDVPVCLSRTGDVFERVGATNRKVRPIEVIRPES